MLPGPLMPQPTTPTVMRLEGAARLALLVQGAGGKHRGCGHANPVGGEEMAAGDS